MNWRLSHRADARALPIADRHYNRQKVGTPQFVPPGRCLVLLTEDAGALWVTSWPFAEYVRARLAEVVSKRATFWARLGRLHYNRAICSPCCRLAPMAWS